MSKQVIGMTPFEEMEKGEMIKFPIDRRSTVMANLSKVRLKHDDRRWIASSGEDYIYIVRDK